MRTTHRLLAFVATLEVLLATPTRGIVAQASDAISDPEAYAVYASVLPARFSTGDTDFTRVAVLQETRSHMGCLPQVGEEWTPVLESYKKENARVRQLLPGFKLGLPYTLVSRSELETQLKDHPGVGPSADGQVYAQFPNRKLLSFSAVGFDQMKTHALVTVQYDCGFDCAGGWHVLREKDGDRWVQPKGNVSTCSWIT
jgi:hypothetical protein